MKTIKIGEIEQFVESSKTNKDKQRELYQYCQQIVTKVTNSYLSHAKKYGINREELESCVADALYIVLKKKNLKYDNFDSYFRKRYEFCILNLILYNEKFYEKHKIFSDIYYNRLEEKKRVVDVVEDKNSVANVAEILTFMHEHSELFDYNEASVIAFYHCGYSLNEIAHKFHWSYSKTKKFFEGTLKKIKHEIDKISSEK